jgi:glutathione S-transferase
MCIIDREGHNPQFAMDHGISHPLYKGSVPCLVDNTDPQHPITLTEAGAICNYLAGKYAPQFTFSNDTAHFANMLRYIFFSFSELEAPLWNIVHHTWLPIPAEKKVPQVIPTDEWRLTNALTVLRGDLKDGREFLVGDKFTIADIVVAFHLGWAARSAHILDMNNDEDCLISWLKRHQQREGYKKYSAME